jgi:hypothetical protein
VAAIEPAGGRKATKKAARRLLFDMRYVFSSFLRPSGRALSTFDTENLGFEAFRAAFKLVSALCPLQRLCSGQKERFI